MSIEALEDRCLPSFSAAVSYLADGSPVAVVIGDFNNDTVLDIAVANSLSRRSIASGMRT